MILVWTFFLLFGDFLDARECQRICGRIDSTSEQDDRDAWLLRDRNKTRTKGPNKSFAKIKEKRASNERLKNAQTCF